MLPRFDFSSFFISYDVSVYPTCSSFFNSKGFPNDAIHGCMYHDAAITGEARERLSLTRTSVDHDAVVEAFFADWLAKLDEVWYTKEK